MKALHAAGLLDAFSLHMYLLMSHILLPFWCNELPRYVRADMGWSFESSTTLPLHEPYYASQSLSIR
jgi:hypothetical protein